MSRFGPDDLSDLAEEWPLPDPLAARRMPPRCECVDPPLVFRDVHGDPPRCIRCGRVPHRRAARGRSG